MEKGFSFIELIVALLIISIMAAFAYPSYSNLLTRAHRLDGQIALLNLAQQLEQHYTNTHDYRHFPSIPQHSPDAWYSLALSRVSKTDYLLVAIPTGIQATTDLACQTLTLDSTGKQGITAGPGGNPRNTPRFCWA